MEVKRSLLEVEGVLPLEVMLCTPLEEMRGVCQYLGEGAVEE